MAVMVLSVTIYPNSDEPGVAYSRPIIHTPQIYNVIRLHFNFQIDVLWLFGLKSQIA